MKESILQRLFPNRFTKILLSIYLVAVAWVLAIKLTSSQGGLINDSYGLILGFIPLLGGLYGLYISKAWGSWQSALGKGVIFLSLGLISWSLGTYIFSGYYNLYAGVAVPYPSLSDVAYILSWPLWGVGMFFLSKATGAKYGLRHRGGKAIFFLVPIVAIVLSYYLLVVVARGGKFDFSDSSMLKIFFDLFYPVGDVVIATVATVIYGLSYNYLGGKFKVAIYFILIGFVLNYIADFSFSYTTTLETFYAGDWVDFLFTTTMFVLSLGVSLLDPKITRERK
ncbi:MAG TPA: hypothetical protein VJH63_00630 [Candidatus Paceibacterota bacterium]